MTNEEFDRGIKGTIYKVKNLNNDGILQESDNRDLGVSMKISKKEKMLLDYFSRELGLSKTDLLMRLLKKEVIDYQAFKINLGEK